MRISTTQPTQNLFFKEQDVPTKTSPQNLRGEEGTHLQVNPDSSAIRCNHPKLSIIKTDKTGPQNWSPLAKLALATIGVIKATALGYLAYTYNSPAAEAPTKSNENFKLPVTIPDTPDTPNPNNYVVHNILNQESASNSSLPLIITAGTICLVIGGILGSLISKGKTNELVLELNNKKNLQNENLTLEITKKKLEQEITDIDRQWAPYRAKVTKRLEEIRETMEEKEEKLQKEQERFSALMTEQERIKDNLNLEIVYLQERKSKHIKEIAELEEKKDLLDAQVGDIKDVIEKLRKDNSLSYI